MSDFHWDVQEALFAKLAGNTGLQALIGNPVRLYDFAPEATVFPYVTFGESEARDFGLKGLAAQNNLLTFSVWSRYRGMKEAKRILSSLRDALHDASYTLTTGGIARCQEEFTGLTRQPDGLTIRGLARYRVVVSA